VIAQTDGSRCRYTIVLAKSIAGLAGLVGAIEGVSQAEVNHESFTLEYGAARHEAADLLEKLISMRLPVASFSANAPDLEAAYLRAGIRQVD
jgi:hypothetical protein